MGKMQSAGGKSTGGRSISSRNTSSKSGRENERDAVTNDTRDETLQYDTTNESTGSANNEETVNRLADTGDISDSDVAGSGSGSDNVENMERGNDNDDKS
ncbi:MAG: hypothetical protein WKF70_10850 [Chitinophagaceae bacterium]